MKVTLYNIYSEEITPIQGEPDEIKAKLKEMIPWLRDNHSSSLEDLIEDIDSGQSYSVEVEEPPKNTDVDTMMKNPLRAERLMALKMDGVSKEHLLQAIKDPEHGMAEEALMHPKVDGDVLHAALAHPRAAVRMLALAHPGIEKEHLDHALMDTDEDVLEQLLQHPQLTEEHIRDIVMNTKAPVGIKAMAVARRDVSDLTSESLFDRVWEEAANEQGQAPVPENVRQPGNEDDAQVGGFQKSLSTWLRKGAMQRLRKAEFVKRELDPRFGYTFSHKHFSPGALADWGSSKVPVTEVKAHDASGREVGYAVFEHLPENEWRMGQNNLLRAYKTNVDQQHRRRGVASAMYAHAEQLTGKKVVPSPNQTYDGQALWAGNAKAPQFSFGKAEDLEKGAMQRLAPFDPKKTALPEEHRKLIARWQSNGAKAPDREALNTQVPPMEGPVRARALHKLSAQTSVRRNPTTGQREFLLHRGMDANEYAHVTAGKATHRGFDRSGFNPTKLGQNPEHTLEPGHVNHPTTSSSWTPRYSLANAFGGYLEPVSGVLPPKRAIVSAWVPESAISHMPFQLGNVNESPAEVNKYPSKGPSRRNEYYDEYEAIVNPNHNSLAATPEEVEAAKNRLATVHGRIADANFYATKPGYNYGDDGVRFRVERIKDRLKPYYRGRQPNETNDPLERMEKGENNLDGEDHPPTDGGYLPNRELAQDMAGFDAYNHPAFLAAKFLTNSTRDLDDKDIRSHLWHEDGDCERAALRAYGLDITDKHLKALKAVMKLNDLKKAEQADEEVPEPKTIVAALPEGDGAAEGVKRAYKEGDVTSVYLKGKHSAGTLVAKDPETGTAWLLKPGSGPLSPAQGIAEEAASQSQREACFWHIASKLGLEDSIPRCDLLMIDGHGVAAIQMLDPSYRNVDKAQKENLVNVLWALNRYRNAGVLHKWAVLDLILGNVDRHAQNEMIDHGRAPRIFLIDHGSAFAGEAFNPAGDKDTFVPHYLRAWAGRAFNKLPPDQKIRYMPRVNPEVAHHLRTWLDGIHADAIASIMHRYGIDPKPILERLAKLKGMTENVDEAVNKLWVTV